MIIDLHFLRPFWLLAAIPLFTIFWHVSRQAPALQAWREVCDSHLLSHLLKNNTHSKRKGALWLLLLSALFMVISLAGPAWTKLPVPTYRTLQPKVVVLDMSESMLVKDISPDRLARAKFKLHDLFQKPNSGQFGLIIYSGEPFVVSPLTDDGQTIDALLPSLSVNIMPVAGERLDMALKEAGQLIKQAGFYGGEVLVMTASLPSTSALNAATTLAGEGIHVSVMPITAATNENSDFESLASAGKGALIPLSDTSTDIEQWLSVKSEKFSLSQQNDFPIWRDEGRWFLLPSLLLLLPVFRRGWLQRIGT